MSKMPQIIKNIFLGIGIGIYILSLLHYPVYSNTLLQLQEEITKKEKEIAEKESVLEGVERRIKEISSSNYSLSQKINLLNEEIQTLEKNIEETEGEIEEKVKGIEEKKGQLEKTKVLIDDISGDLYIQSRYKLTSFFLNGANWFTIVESLYVRKSAISTLKKEIEKIGGEFSSLAESKAELDKEKEDLDKQREGLDEAHRLLAEEKAKVQAELSKEVASKGTLTKRIESLETQISHLLEEQKEIARREAALLGAPPPPQSLTPPEIPPNGFYIAGRGRDLYQGHGIGMSQYGAYGGANKGMSALEILKFYYTGVQITPGYENRTINVEGYGSMNIEKYVAGFGSWAGAQGEVPAKACGTNEQAQNNPEKYTTNSGCWPEEAIKAQAIAYRTYGLYSTSNGSTICTTSSCQVYNGQNFTAWAAEETKGMVLTYGGSLISAVYSSDNSQGAGTANNETVWQTFEGKGYPQGYLRAVNDSSFAQPTRWTQWVYQTKGYTYDDVLKMLKSQTSRSEINMANKIEKIDFERDPSGRVAKMFFYFDTSPSPQPVGGWWFKSLWNLWQGDLGGTDYIYSQTFYFLFE